MSLIAEIEKWGYPSKQLGRRKIHGPNARDRAELSRGARDLFGTAATRLDGEKQCGHYRSEKSACRVVTVHRRRYDSSARIVSTSSNGSQARASRFTVVLARADRRHFL